MADLTMVRGDDQEFELAIEIDGTPVDLDGCFLWFTAKNDIGDLDEDAVLAKTSALNGGIEITNADAGAAKVVIAADDTADLDCQLDGSPPLVWDVQVRDGTGRIRTVASGTLRILADVTRATA